MTQPGCAGGQIIGVQAVAHVFSMDLYEGSLEVRVTSFDDFSVC